MKTVRMLFLSCFALLAFGAVASASASAAACTSLEKAGCIEVAGSLTLSLAVTGTKTPSTGSELEVAGIGKVVCTAATSSTTLDETEANGVEALNLVISFSGCSLSGKPACKIAEPIATNSILGNLHLNAAGTGLELLFVPTTGTEFATVKIEKCEQEATIKVTGEQLCSAPGDETAATSHEILCAVSGSKLKDGTKEAKFSLSETVKASGEPLFNVKDDAF